MIKKKSKALYTLIVGMMLLSVVFMGATIILAIGMLPTAVAFMADRTPEKLRGMTVGFTNFAGCMPFLLDLMNGGGSKEMALSIIGNPSSIIIMYLGACLGYVVEWLVTSIVATLMVQRGERRLEAIAKRKKSLVLLWGEEVTGRLSVDRDGFPFDEGKS